ncbi:GTP-binding protein, partial [Pseudomonas aeruginosa]
TTLLRQMLDNAEGRRIAVIVNEFGELGIDGEILKQCSIGCSEEEAQGRVFELANWSSNSSCSGDSWSRLGSWRRCWSTCSGWAAKVPAATAGLSTTVITASTVQEEFFPVMRELVARGGDLDQNLIETSGLSLPKPLVEAFQWPEIRNACT